MEKLYRYTVILILLVCSIVVQANEAEQDPCKEDSTYYENWEDCQTENEELPPPEEDELDEDLYEDEGEEEDEESE